MSSGFTYYFDSFSNIVFVSSSVSGLIVPVKKQVFFLYRRVVVLSSEKRENVGQHGSSHTLERKSCDVISELTSWFIAFFSVQSIVRFLLRQTGRHLVSFSTYNYNNSSNYVHYTARKQLLQC